MTDLLLLNATNYQPNLIFPYAFVQVRAVARAHGLRVQSHDLFGLDAQAQAGQIARLLQRARPRAVGFTVRQADSLSAADYVPAAAGDAGPRQPYFPLAATRQAIRLVRESFSGPVVLGGFGFTVQPQALLQELEADLGVAGEPDAFFRDFAGALAGAPVANVVRPGVAESPRSYFAPLDEREYDDEALDAMERFYGHSVLYGPGAPTVAVELARGCPYRCTFCAEPAVKGRQPRVRDLDAVFGDIEFLASRGVRSFWLVCSELNHGSAELAQQVARRFLALRERQPSRRLSWRAYLLPRWLSDADMDLLYRSGFAGGWNDFPALDDQALRANRVPYRTRHVHEHLEQTLALHARASTPAPATFGAFLGNAHAEPRALVATLDYFDRHFYGRFARAQVGAATRLLPTMDAALLDALRPQAVSFRPEGPSAELELSHPTYGLSPAMARALGGLAEAGDWFEHVRVTFLSAQFEAALDWPQFLRQSLLRPGEGWLWRELAQLRLALPPAAEAGGVGQALARLRQDPDQVLRELCEPAAAERALAERVIRIVCHRVASRCALAPALLGWLGFASDSELSPWRLFRACSLRWDSLEELLAELPWRTGDEGEAARWLLRYHAFRHGLRLEPCFSRLLRAGVQASSGAEPVAAAAVPARHLRLPVLPGAAQSLPTSSPPASSTTVTSAMEGQSCQQH